jgi:hypothetical protein
MGSHRCDAGAGAGSWFEAFIEAYPGSAWTPSIRCNLAFRYRELGRNTLALEHWAAAWDATAEAQDPGGKRVADFTLVYWTRLLASLGRREALIVLFAETQGRVLDRGPCRSGSMPRRRVLGGCSPIPRWLIAAGHSPWYGWPGSWRCPIRI